MTMVRTRTAQYGKALHASLDSNGPSLDYEAEVASIAVMDGDKILMGRRRDSGRWTLPGGHLEGGEDPLEGALRELAEETGIQAHSLNYLGSQGVVTELGKAVMVHAYHMTASPETTVAADPDQEVTRWRWIDCSRGLPEHIASNLHSKRNVTLMFLDIYRSFGAGLYIADLMKSRGHKYLRKYKGKNGDWVYVYHEGDAHGRAIPEEAVKHLKELADLGHEPSRQLHETLEAHSEEKLKSLRELSDLGHEPATAHLKKLGIDRASEKKKEKAAEAERQILGENSLTKPLDDFENKELNAIMSDSVKKVFDHLGGHRTSPLGQALFSSGLSVERITAGLGAEKTVAGKLKAFDEKLKMFDRVLNKHRSANSSVTEAGSYGNLAYNRVVTKLVADGYLPQEAASHRRGETLPVEKLRHASRDLTTRRQTERTDRTARVEREARERQEREKRERQARAEEERQAAAEIEGSLAKHITSLFANSRSNLTAQGTVNLHRALTNIFGKNLRKEDWPYDFSAHGLRTEVLGVSVSRDGEVVFDLQVKDQSGKAIMESWTRSWKKGQDGRPMIYNSFMRVKSSARTGVQIGSLINQGQRQLMKSIPGGGMVRVTANIDVGGYNWANQGFTWTHSDSVSSYRRDFQYFAASNGVRLTNEDMEHFKDPVHFASFDNGKRYIRLTSTTMELSQKQKDTGSITGVRGEHSLTSEETRTGKTERMACHLGKMFMLGKNWGGTWDSNKENDATKFAEKYYALRERAIDHLKPEYKAVVEAAKAGKRAARSTESAPSPAVPRSTFGSTAPTEDHAARAQRYVRYWRRGTGNITITARRLNTIRSWPAQSVREFLRTADLTANARSRIRTATGV